MKKHFIPFCLLTLCALGIAHNAFAGEAKTLCVYDPSGANGDAYATMKDYQVAASAWGVDFTLKPYTNEKTAADDFKADKCDAVFLTGVRARGFTKFAATVEALGATPSYELLGKAIALMAQPKVAPKLKSGDYETAMVMPMGAVYIMVRDKSWNSIESIAGKKISTIGFDAAATYMVKLAGASMVAADISTFGGIFNNGAADICYAPATAFKPLELEKGVKDKGGIIRYPIAQLTGQVLIHSSKFTPEFAQSSREYGSQNFGKILQLSTKSDASIASKYWIDIDKDAKARYDALFQDVRIKLRDEDKIYDKEMLGMMRRLRCKEDNARPECAQKRE
ncbi:MAG: hypothetical protein IJU23_11385 [Proteobacteria bacterium]|nr:hypothetical protein [Pseudomonadota bacterium]MBQ9816005.1 hypothetical protein [Pseudomonadota bacterium]